MCESNFWLDLNYLEVAGAAQMCSAHFTALLYSEIYMDKIRSNMEQIRRSQSRVSRRITFEESSQTLSVSSVNEKSLEDSGISLQDLLIEVYRCIGEPDSLYGCGGGKLISPLTRIRTYEHEAMWDKALVSYDLHSNLPEVTRQTGIVEGLQNFGLCSILNTYLHGLEKEGVEWGPELRELRFQAAWRNTQWDCDLPERCWFVFTLFKHYFALVEVCIRVMVETCQSVEILLYLLYCGIYSLLSHENKCIIKYKNVRYENIIKKHI